MWSRFRALRWHGRFPAEASDVTLAEAQAVLALLAVLRAGRERPLPLARSPSFSTADPSCQPQKCWSAGRTSARPVAANRLDGDPVWLVLVGPPGGGKSEILTSVAGLRDVHPTATLTEAALLSGTPRRERDAEAKGGLLRAIGDFGICKDFGSVLSMNRDARAAVLAALREVYDDSWTRHVGTGGGRTLTWSGKVGLVAGATPTIDRHHAVMGAMGERFVLFRLPEVDASEQARRALAHAGREKEMRQEIGATVAALFDVPLPVPPPLDANESERLVSLATLVVRCRSAVERDGYSREVELIPEPEAPTRLAVVLERLLAGMDVIGVERSEGLARHRERRARQHPRPSPRRHERARAS